MANFDPLNTKANWGNILRESDTEAYLSAAPFRGTGDSPWNAFQKYWQGQQGDVYSQYQGQAGQSMRQGQAPMSFVDFLDDYDFTQRYSALPPSLRPGSSTSRFAPSTRYVY